MNNIKTYPKHMYKGNAIKLTVHSIYLLPVKII